MAVACARRWGGIIRFCRGVELGPRFYGRHECIAAAGWWHRHRCGWCGARKLWR
jgi:hypothetical protein